MNVSLPVVLVREDNELLVPICSTLAQTVVHADVAMARLIQHCNVNTAACQCIQLHPCSQPASRELRGAWRSNLFARRCSARSRCAPGRPSDVAPRWYQAPASDSSVVGEQSQDRAQADHLRVNTRMRFSAGGLPALGRWSSGYVPRR